MYYDIPDHLPAKARAFIDSLQQDILGKFAVDREHLYLMYVVEMRRLALPDSNAADYESDASDAAFGRFAMAGAELARVVPPDIIPAVRSELVFWLRDRGMPWVVVDGDRDLELGMSHEKVEAVAKSPSTYHSYFMAGIWDVTLIERFVAEGVDPELARSIFPLE